MKVPQAEERETNGENQESATSHGDRTIGPHAGMHEGENNEAHTDGGSDHTTSQISAFRCRGTTQLMHHFRCDGLALFDCGTQCLLDVFARAVTEVERNTKGHRQ